MGAPSGAGTYEASAGRRGSLDANVANGRESRVALARVLAQGCDVLLLDEPTAALDVSHQELALGVMRREADAGRGVVVAIHDLDAAAAYADRLVVMDAGTVVADGTPRDVLTTVDLGAVFGVPIEVVVDGQGRTVVRPARTPVGRGDG